MNRRTWRTRQQDLCEAADRILTLPEAGAIATEMALRDVSIARWTLRSQCVLQLQEQQIQTGTPTFTITELGTREGWARRGRAPVAGATWVYIFSESRRERASFSVFDRSQTRLITSQRGRRSTNQPDAARMWMRTLQRMLRDSYGIALQREAGECIETGIDGQRLIFTAPDHRSPAALAALAQHCASLLLAG